MGAGQACVTVKKNGGDHRHSKQASEFCDKKIVCFILKEWIFDQSKYQTRPKGHLEMFPGAFIYCSDNGYRSPIIGPFKPEVKGGTKNDNEKYTRDLPALNFIHNLLSRSFYCIQLLCGLIKLSPQIVVGRWNTGIQGNSNNRSKFT